MDVAKRIKTCQLIEKMNQKEVYSCKLGLVNTSKFHNQIVKAWFNEGEKTEWSLPVGRQ